MKTVIAIDALGCERKGDEGKEFIAPLGIAVVVSKGRAEDFKKAYSKIIDDILKKHNKPREKTVYKSYDLLVLLGLEEGFSALQEFSRKIGEHLDGLHVFFSVFNINKLPKAPDSGEPAVWAYKDNRSGVRHISFKKFLHKLVEAYPYICAWRLACEGALKDSVLLMDSFDSELTPAWSEIEGCKDFHILTYGDHCSEFIATSDILLKVLELRMQRGRKKLTRDSIGSCLPEHTKKVKIGYMGHEALGKMAPSSGDVIDVRRKIKHPVVFVVPPEAPIAGSRDLTLKSPIMKRIFDLACQHSGCVKFFEKRDADFIKEGDIFVCPDESKAKWEKFLKTLGYRGLSVVSLEKLGGYKE